MGMQTFKLALIKSVKPLQVYVIPIGSELQPCVRSWPTANLGQQVLTWTTGMAAMLCWMRGTSSP